MKGGLLIALLLAFASLAVLHLNTEEKYSEFEEWKKTYEMNFET
jgi:hypothetical protein